MKHFYSMAYPMLSKTHASQVINNNAKVTFEQEVAFPIAVVAVAVAVAVAVVIAVTVFLFYGISNAI